METAKTTKKTDMETAKTTKKTDHREKKFDRREKYVPPPPNPALTIAANDAYKQGIMWRAQGYYEWSNQWFSYHAALGRMMTNSDPEAWRKLRVPTNEHTEQCHPKPYNRPAMYQGVSVAGGAQMRREEPRSGHDSDSDD